MATLPLLAEGAYARKQLFCKDALIAWSHGSRFRMACRLVEPFAGQRLLDYGCGDGTFLAQVQDRFPDAVGADVDPQQTADCNRRLAGLGGLSFVLTRELADERHAGAYDVIVCMEVLEHCLDEDVEQVLGDIDRLAAPNGHIVLSVPIEIGPSLVFKHLARTVAGWRNLGDYRYNESYSFRQFWKMVFAGPRTKIRRRAYRCPWSPEHVIWSYGHKGFTWHKLRVAVAERFHMQQTLFSPLGWLGGFFSSQVWFVCQPRPDLPIGGRPPTLSHWYTKRDKEVQVQNRFEMLADQHNGPAGET
jgi:2-polyprenyl-3-methyl-5-hydroxy-6-metoxy-1,4-benzoquinol methylase